LGVSDVRQTAAPFANPLVFLFLGGFLIALTMQRWQLHRRIALNILAQVSNRPAALVGGFMTATALLSMWVSNTATTMMMLPIAVSVIGIVTPDGAISGDAGDGKARNLGIALMLGVAYAASIGGIGTLIGTPPNALLAAFMSENFGVEIGFAGWLMFGLPVVFVMLPLTWLMLTRVVYPSDIEAIGSRALVAGELEGMGRMTVPEKRVAAVAAFTALLWVLRPSLNGLPGLDALTDAGIAVSGALLLFVIRAGAGNSGFLMDWQGTKDLPWGTLILFGGGLSLAAAVDRSGLASWIGETLAVFGALPLVVVIAAVTAVIILLTELTSNTATTAAFLPVVAAIAVGSGWQPMTLAAPAALAASCAFMLPVATPPNAIVYGTGLVTVPQMVRAGAVLNMIGVVAVTALARLLVPVLF
jgi:sodium-dependent dicarboxylate transporter 2/3/5